MKKKSGHNNSQLKKEIDLKKIIRIIFPINFKVNKMLKYYIILYKINYIDIYLKYLLVIHFTITFFFYLFISFKLCINNI